MTEETTTRYHVRRREFLNEDPELPAFVIGVVEDTRELPDDPGGKWKYATIVLDFGDCFRRVSFHFDLSDESERAHSLRKINLIVEVVSAVRDAMEIEAQSRNARPVKESE